MRRILIDLMRHGEAEGADCYRGRTDFPLTADGRVQMQAWLGADFTWQAVLSSPLARCADMAQLLACQSGLVFKTHPALLEYDFGAWDGQPYAAVWQSESAQVEAFWNDPELAPPPGGETPAGLAARISALQDELVLAPHDHWLLVTHGGVIRAWLAQILEIPARRWSSWQLAPASLTRIQLDIEPGSGRVWASIGFVNQAAPQ